MLQDPMSVYNSIVGLLKERSSSLQTHFDLQVLALKVLEATDAQHLLVQIHLGSA